MSSSTHFHGPKDSHQRWSRFRGSGHYPRASGGTVRTEVGDARHLGSIPARAGEPSAAPRSGPRAAAMTFRASAIARRGLGQEDGPRQRPSHRVPFTKYRREGLQRSLARGEEVGPRPTRSQGSLTRFSGQFTCKTSCRFRGGGGRCAVNESRPLSPTNGDLPPPPSSEEASSSSGGADEPIVRYDREPVPARGYVLAWQRLTLRAWRPSTTSPACTPSAHMIDRGQLLEWSEDASGAEGNRSCG